LNSSINTVRPVSFFSAGEEEKIGRDEIRGVKGVWEPAGCSFWAGTPAFF
jgi:hypothetical protein